MSGPTDTGNINFSRGDEPDSGREVDAETTVSAAAVAFNNAALPPDMPEWLKATIRAEASAIIETMRDDDIRLTDAKQRREDEQDNQLQNLLVRESEWDKSRVEIGSVTLSGQEWDDAYELLSDPDMRSRLIDGMVRKKGWSKDRAEKAADDALTLAQIAQRRKDGTMTAADEAQAQEITRRNPDAAVMVKEAARAEKMYGADNVVESGEVLTSRYGSTDMAIASRQAELAATPVNTNFRAASDLTTHFDNACVVASDKPSDKDVKPAPSLVANISMDMTF